MEPPPPPENDVSVSLRLPFLAVSVVMLAIGLVVYALPERHGATAVALVFFGATWGLVLRHDHPGPAAFGLSLAGFFERDPLRAGHVGRVVARSLGWCALLCLVIFPPFFAGYGWFWHHTWSFVWRPPPHLLDEMAGQLLVIALPEEAFFRGYLQTSLDARWAPRWRVLGARLGPGWLVASGLFAVGHLITDPRPERLAVFFPSLVFGWLRARTGDVLPGVFFHAACNLFSHLLARGFGLLR